MPAHKKLVIGNWKMNGTRAFAQGLLSRMGEEMGVYQNVDIVLCPPATLLPLTGEWTQLHSIALGGQDCHPEPSGAFTGDIAPEMLADLGAAYVIVGHSERRTHHHEDNALVADKATAAFRAGLVPIICVGETEEVRQAGNASAFVAEELKRSLPKNIEGSIVIAYEPLWAIGTGKTCHPTDIAAMHDTLKKALTGISEARLVYGGSVNPRNAAEILAQPNVDGVLVGGASLDAKEFTAIVAAAARIG